MKTPKRGRGRPAFQPTAAMRRTVELMVSCGDSKETVARAIGCSVPTLELHFDEELKN
ncbi:resolvase, partial [Mesorhizobium sp. M3A.F.Ca.ET.175.01.1.1]